MKKFLVIFLIGLGFASCQKAIKDPNDVIPELQMISATVEADSTVTVVGKVVSSGVFELVYGGFCYSKDPNPSIEQNQILAFSYQDPYLTGVYDDLTWGETYYIKCWCANSDLYGASPDLEITVE